MKKRSLFVSIVMCLCITLSSACFLTGCSGLLNSGEETEETKETEKEGKGDKDKKEKTSADNLEENAYYVYSEKSGYKKLAVGEASFDYGKIVTSPNDKRVIWFKENFKEIPVLYSGDKLIYNSSQNFDEVFVFERFEPFGYTIGLCGMETTESGRLSLSGDKDKKCTYPGGDTDKILQLQVDSVTIGSIGGGDIRTKMGSLTRCGTITGLQKGANYETIVYTGTKPHTYNFKADAFVLGSMEVYKSHSYDYGSDESGVIEITIPSFFNSGYYLINGVGLFIYVKDGDKVNLKDDGKAGEKVDGFTTPNELPADEIDQTYMGPATFETTDGEKKVAEETKSKFNILSPGEIMVRVSFSLRGGSTGGGDGLTDVTAVLTTPSKTRNMTMLEDMENDCLYLQFYAEETGTYEISYYDLDIRVPHIDVQPVIEE